jgi:hypothetical protein
LWIGVQLICVDLSQSIQEQSFINGYTILRIRANNLDYQGCYMNKIFLLPMFFCIALASPSNAAVYTATDSSGVPTPDIVDNGSASFTVDISAPAGELVSNTVIALTFGKSDTNACDDIGTDDLEGYNDEIGYTLESPSGTTVTLIEDDSSDSETYPESDTITLLGTVVTLDDDAAADVGSTNFGTPETGSFRPAFPLAAFFGENPTGTWTLTASDNANSDVLCHQSFSLTVTTPAPPAPPKPVPTMGIWGLCILSGMIGFVGMYFRRQK